MKSFDLAKIFVSIYKDNFTDDGFYDSEKAYIVFAKTFNFKLIDSYASFKGVANEGEFLCLNAYGQEDLWEGTDFDFVFLFKDHVDIFKYSNDNIDFKTIPFDLTLNFENFGGKRGYYLESNLVRFRTSPDFYHSLPEQYKIKEYEEDLSGPHFTVRF